MKNNYKNCAWINITQSTMHILLFGLVSMMMCATIHRSPSYYRVTLTGTLNYHPNIMKTLTTTGNPEVLCPPPHPAAPAPAPAPGPPPPGLGTT